jgi:putative addiction module killer protein
MKNHEVIHYKEFGGDVPFQKWLNRLEGSTAERIYRALERMEAGNFSDSKSLKGGIWERRIHAGPGYRIYYAIHYRRYIIMLCGGTKQTQVRDIRKARRMWYEFKSRTN